MHYNNTMITRSALHVTIASTLISLQDMQYRLTHDRICSSTVCPYAHILNQEYMQADSYTLKFP